MVNRIRQTALMIIVFVFFGQFKGFSGSSGPSQSTITGFSVIVGMMGCVDGASLGATETSDMPPRLTKPSRVSDVSGRRWDKLSRFSSPMMMRCPNQVTNPV